MGSRLMTQALTHRTDPLWIKLLNSSICGLNFVT